jgi:hypothetical protein
VPGKEPYKVRVSVVQIESCHVGVTNSQYVIQKQNHAMRTADRFTVKIMDSEKYVARRSDVVPLKDPMNSN